MLASNSSLPCSRILFGLCGFSSYKRTNSEECSEGRAREEPCQMGQGSDLHSTGFCFVLFIVTCHEIKSYSIL